MTKPIIPPASIWTTNFTASSLKGTSGLVSHVIAVIVKNTAIGSLLPDSNSNMGFKVPLSPIFWVRKIENTAAASVDEIIAPSRNASLYVNWGSIAMGTAAATAVNNTPKVESTTP